MRPAPPGRPGVRGLVNDSLCWCPAATMGDDERSTGRGEGDVGTGTGAGPDSGDPVEGGGIMGGAIGGVGGGGGAVSWGRGR